MGQATLPIALRNWLITTLQDFPNSVEINFWKDQTLKLGEKTEEPSVKLFFCHPGVLRSLVFQRDPLVLTEAYFNGWFDFQGDIETAVQLGKHLAYRGLKQSQGIKTWLQSLKLPRLPLKPNVEQEGEVHSKERDRAAIQHHYDLGDEFYQLWLDPEMVYSCAHFEHPYVPLNEAQAHKLDLACRKLKLEAGETLLDIGCGWGGMLRWAAKNYGIKGCGITLSEKQVEYNQKRIHQEGLEDQIEVKLLDYRDLPTTPTFDKVVSIGMVEHVGLKQYPAYFDHALKCLKPGGLFLNHGITSTDAWNGSSLGERFINHYIFPDGELVPLTPMLREAEEVGWEIVDVDNWRPHYALTLRSWADNLASKKAEAVKLIGEKLYKIWQLYLIGCAIGFEENQMAIYQTLMRRQSDQKWNLPLIRKGWLV
ncbi:class I SAM-dependent methyltransferase [Euhalothece natronophila Z-M001]|uniref:Class I SAM-dependent methyltransferase n=1 Tax=Euhalothece natronophila Z-M001 TaxID=522448 RepID=A0A5B8NNI8_9CHRO|nr:cyclopropane-fatty-acyl-phospholipid synthase family protein [Euhalothece natronophila]QDZ40618.1 class I SAM-dependent methyltransferase [Euhalothece natronophila Z-M001]